MMARATVVKLPTVPTTSNSQWSRSTRYSLGIPLTANEATTVQAQQVLRKTNAMFYLPSGSYRGWSDMEQDVCNAIFGTLYKQGEKTDFAMYAEIELLYFPGKADDAQGERQKPDCRIRQKTSLTEENWDEIVEMIIFEKIIGVEFIANWRRSRKARRPSRNLSTNPTPANFPMRQASEAVSVLDRSPGKDRGGLLRRISATGASSFQSTGTGGSRSPTKSMANGGRVQRLIQLDR